MTPPSAFPGLPSQSAEMAAEAPPEPQWEAPTKRKSQPAEAAAPPRRTPRPMDAVTPPHRTSQPMESVTPSEPMRISEQTIPGPKMPLVAPPSAPVAVPQLYSAGAALGTLRCGCAVGPWSRRR